MLPAMLLSILIGTYLDLYFVGKGFYTFPVRPWPEVFSINIAFTLFGLPLVAGCFLVICSKLTKWNKGIFIVVLGLLAGIFEKMAEEWGLFLHHEVWKHYYSILGYSLFFSIIYTVNYFINKRIKTRA